MPDNDFDQASRYVARHFDVAGFFHWLLGDTFVGAWKFIDWLDTQAVPFPGEPDRRSDTVAAFQRRRGAHAPLAVVVEFMSQTRRATLRRLTQYGLQLQEDCPYQLDPRVEYDFVGVVVNLTGGEQEETLTIAPPKVGKLGLRVRFAVRTLASMSAIVALDRVATGEQSRAILVWCPLMSDADTEDLVNRWRAEVERETNAELRVKVVVLAQVFADLGKRGPLWRRVLEGMNVERSAFVMEWENRGAMKATRNNLCAVLRARLKKNIPEDVQRRIEAEEDLPTLSAWLDAAVTSDDLPSVLASLVSNGGK